MTRFKELRRIQAAIKNKDQNEILWSINYCKTRLQFAKLKQHIKHWKKLINELEDAIEQE